MQKRVDRVEAKEEAADRVVLVKKKELGGRGHYILYVVAYQNKVKLRNILLRRLQQQHH
jgi:predicted RNA-binding protein YlxR (DUF448 family)